MPTLSGLDKLRLLLLASLSSTGNGDSSSAASSGDKMGNGSGASALSVSSTELDQLAEELKSLHPELDISAVRYAHHLR